MLDVSLHNWENASQTCTTSARDQTQGLTQSYLAKFYRMWLKIRTLKVQKHSHNNLRGNPKNISKNQEKALYDLKVSSHAGLGCLNYLWFGSRVCAYLVSRIVMYSFRDLGTRKKKTCKHWRQEPWEIMSDWFGILLTGPDENHEIERNLKQENEWPYKIEDKWTECQLPRGGHCPSLLLSILDHPQYSTSFFAPHLEDLQS